MIGRSGYGSDGGLGDMTSWPGGSGGAIWGGGSGGGLSPSDRGLAGLSSSYRVVCRGAAGATGWSSSL
jgi:hypothetical protein